MATEMVLGFAEVPGYRDLEVVNTHAETLAADVKFGRPDFNTVILPTMGGLALIAVVAFSVSGIRERRRSNLLKTKEPAGADSLEVETPEI